MEKYAFISRHLPTESQKKMAGDRDIDLIPAGDADAFKISASFLDGHEKGPFDGVVVVHPAAALRLASQFVIGVFENSDRAPVGERPRFEAKELHLYDLRD